MSDDCTAVDGTTGLLVEREALRAALKRTEAERDALRAEVERLRAFVRQLRSDGLDIDDPDTAPTWTGMIHDADGRLLFDLATVGAPRKP